MAKKRFGMKLWPFPLYFKVVLTEKWPLHRRHFPCEFRAHPYLFGIRRARGMGLDRVLIQIPTFNFFAPPPLMVTYGPLGPRMVPYRLVLSCMVPYGHLLSLLVTNGPLWPRIVLYGPVWLPMVTYGPLWPCMVPFCPVWSRVVTDCHLWLLIVTFSLHLLIIP